MLCVLVCTGRIYEFWKALEALQTPPHTYGPSVGQNCSSKWTEMNECPYVSEKASSDHDTFSRNDHLKCQKTGADKTRRYEDLAIGKAWPLPIDKQTNQQILSFVCCWLLGRWKFKKTNLLGFPGAGNGPKLSLSICRKSSRKTASFIDPPTSAYATVIIITCCSDDLFILWGFSFDNLFLTQ